MAQAHSFLQVCRKEFEFDLACREIVLLSYDKLSVWIQLMEKQFLREDGHPASETLRKHAISSFTDVLRVIEGTCIENPEVFGHQAVEFLKMIHSYAPTLMAEGLTSVLDAPSARAFSRLVDLTSDYLQHVLISMHEYNNNILLHKSPFICIANFCLLQRMTDGKKCKLISLRTRAAYFRKKLAQDCEFILKNYTNEDLSDESIELLNEMGIFAKGEVVAT